MERLLPAYPTYINSNLPKQETLQVDLAPDSQDEQPITTDTARTTFSTTPSSPSHAALHQPSTFIPYHLYSPTRKEIEDHPIRQRLSIASRDEIVTGLGAAIEEGEAPAQIHSNLEHTSISEDAMADTQVKEGDQVAWNWGSGAPGGEATKVAEDSVTMETKRGNTVEKKGESGNPAVYIEREGHDVVKKANELKVVEEGDKHKGEKKENGDAQTGEKRVAAETAEEKKDEEGDDTKKQKTDKKPKENGAEPKKKGRPAKGAANGPKKDAKKKAPKKAATESGQPRRSGRNAGKSE